MKNYICDIAKINKADRFNAIVDTLSKNGVYYEIQKINRSGSLGNIIVKPKKDSADKVVVSAHYDNAYGTPGANDNASACSILLNLILDFKDSDKNIEFVFFDLEERGFVGCRNYLQQLDKPISFAVNLDMCGMGENLVYAHYNSGNGNLKSLESLAAKYNGRYLKDLPPGDAYAFREQGIETLYIVNSTNHDLDWFEQYAMSKYSLNSPDFGKTMHQPSDTVDTINVNQVEIIYCFVKDLLTIC